MQKISLIIPAHNEEKFIGKCLASVKAAAAHIDTPVETVVVLTGCTDSTESLPQSDAGQLKKMPAIWPKFAMPAFVLPEAMRLSPSMPTAG